MTAQDGRGAQDRGTTQDGAGARDEVLARIRTALGPRPAVPAVPRGYRVRGEHPPGSAALLALFRERVEDYTATVREVRDDGVPAAVAAALEAHGATAVVAPAGLPPGWVPGGRADTDIGTGTGTGDGTLSAAELDAVHGVVTTCAVAVAETGTIVLDGGPGQGRRAPTLVPDLHVCVVRADQVVQTVPEAVAVLDPTRPLTWISGPSATSDIELDRVEGVHGPRTLVVLLVTTE